LSPISTKDNFDYLIIGNGLAGTYAAYRAASYGRVLLVGKTRYGESASAYAQGGIAAALGPSDDWHKHYDDTLHVARGLAFTQAVEVLVQSGPAGIMAMQNDGLAFDMRKGHFYLGREAGHSEKRILQSGGTATGKSVMDFYRHKVEQMKNIRILEDAWAEKLIVQDGNCCGAQIGSATGSALFFAHATLLATGGAGALYSTTTNPKTALGEGIALAFEAGATIRDIEFVQFHPTVYSANKERTFLFSEALRGEGAIVVDAHGERFLTAYHRDAEMAPRDIVARAIFTHLDANPGGVFLRMHGFRNTPGTRHKYSNIIRFCQAEGFDFFRDPIPIEPAAHYFIGGVKTDLNGETTIRSLFAIGEVASVGVHGANRLASNSLLECIVFAERAIQYARQGKPGVRIEAAIENISRLNYSRQTARQVSQHLGLIRTGEAIEDFIKQLSKEHQQNTPSCLAEKTVLLMAIASLLRKESRGVFWRNDFPATAEVPQHTEINKQTYGLVKHTETEE
jgi:L-aspartate oxidase